LALKLRCIEFCELLRVHFFTFLLNLVAIFVQLRFFLLWFGRRYVEDALGGFEADRVTVKDITAILAVVLAESPPDSFVDQVSRNLILRVLLGEVVDFDFDVKNFKALGILGMLELVQLVQVVILLLKLVASINNFFAFSPYRSFLLDFVLVIGEDRRFGIVDVCVRVPVVVSQSLRVITPLLFQLFVLSELLFSL